MKRKFISLLFVLCLFFISCKDDNNNQGNAIFYTNAQYVLNCGDFNVDVYIDKEYCGTLSRPFLDKPTCSTTSTDGSILKVIKDEGLHDYYAVIKCSNMPDTCKGTFSINSHNCTIVFLNVESLNKKKN